MKEERRGFLPIYYTIVDKFENCGQNVAFLKKHVNLTFILEYFVNRFFNVAVWTGIEEKKVRAFSPYATGYSTRGTFQNCGQKDTFSTK